MHSSYIITFHKGSDSTTTQDNNQTKIFKSNNKSIKIFGLVPEMTLLERLKSGSWSAPETALQTAPLMAPEDFDGACKWHLQWRLQMAPEDWRWRSKTALLLRAFFKPPDWRQNGAPHRHHSSRRCKEDTTLQGRHCVFLLRAEAGLYFV